MELSPLNTPDPHAGNTVYAIPNPIEPWVDVHAVAKHVGICRATADKLRREGKIPGKPIRNGSKTFWRFKLSEVDEAIKAGWSDGE
jgi:predicted DNA-binding transcriptional regulator AlpA